MTDHGYCGSPAADCGMKRITKRSSLLPLLVLGMIVLLATSAMAGDILYQDNFKDVPDGQLPEDFFVTGGRWEVQEGRLIGQSASFANGQIVFGDSTWTDYEIEATITFLSTEGPSRWAALMYRGPMRGGSPYYLYTIRQNAAASNGVELAYRTPAEQWNVHLTKSWNAPIEIGRPYSIRAFVYETGAVYFFEGEQIIETETLVQKPSGTVGFITNGTRIAIENVVVRTLGEEKMASLPRIVRGVTPVATNVRAAAVPLVIAHRGASGVAPENTITAFQLAADIGSDLIELDVHKTRDGHLVVIHDATVDRTAKGTYRGAIANLTLEQIRSLDAGGWKSLQTRGERVPTLEEALLSTDGQAMFLIENKVTGLEREIAEVIRSTGMQNNVVFQSFDASSVKTFRGIMPEVPAGVLFGNPGIHDDVDRAAALVEQALRANASVVAVNYGAVTPAFVRYVQARGLNVWTWTVNQEADMRRMLDAGVDGIITDYPERLKALMDT